MIPKIFLTFLLTAAICLLLWNVFKDTEKASDYIALVFAISVAGMAISAFAYIWI